MHGRLKVRTTAEEKERKKKEEAVKLRAYRSCMTKIQEKRDAKEYDDEMLQVIGQILQRNPDVATLWNIRRQCLLRKTQEFLEEIKEKAQQQQEKQEKEGEEQTQEEEERIKFLEEEEEKLQKAYDSELTFTEHCLMANPKSYCCWHQRCWVLEHCPKANWNREVQLCNKYLKLDERNFHTWDYRRFVVEKAGVEKQKELDFCTEKIKVNFSNYSSWHHRSLLLPVLYPYDGDALPKRPMNEEKLKQELEMVITAAFTDPNDSSAWFYQRWLLGQSEKEPAICAFRCDEEKAVLAFTQALETNDLRVSLKVEGQEEGGSFLDLSAWSGGLRGSSKVDSVWFSKVPSSVALDSEKTYLLDVEIPEKTFPQVRLQWKAGCLCYFVPPNRAFKYSQGVKDELKSQLESCNSLLEFEPDSKWTLLTSALLMREIDPLAYHQRSLENLKKLETVDALRIGYYKDLASKWLLEKFFNDWFESGEEFPRRIVLTEEKYLVSLQYPQYFSIGDVLELSPELQEAYRNRKLPRLFSEIGK